MRTALTGRTHGCTDHTCDVKILLANSEPSTHGTKRSRIVAWGGVTDSYYLSWPLAAKRAVGVHNSRAPCSVALQGLGGELRAKNSCMYFGKGCVTGGRGIVRERRKPALVGGPELL